MICSGRDKIETPEQVRLLAWWLNDLMGVVFSVYFYIAPEYDGLYFQFKQAEETAKKLDLDGLVVIGGDDSNTNACLLAENFRCAMMFLI